MKTERRHELQTNDLADWIGQKAEAIQPYWKSILAGAILLFGGVVVYLVFVSSQRANAREGWQAYFQAANEGNAAQLEGVGQENAGTQPGLWATLSAADLKLGRASFDITRNREESKKPLEEAVTLYNRVLERAADQPMLRRRALFGLAQSYECLSVADGRLSKNEEYLGLAKKTYERLLNDGKDTVLGQEAAARLEALIALAGAKPEENFYWWYASQEPVKPGAGGGLDGGTGTGIGSGAPGGSGLNIPGLDKPFDFGGGSPGTGTDPGTDPNAPRPFPGSPPSPDPEPTGDPANPADPAKPATDPAKPATDPAKPATDPAKPATDPAKPATDPAKPATDPAKPATDPAKPATDAAKPATDAAKPATDPAKPATDPAKPATDPAKPATDPAKPATDPAKPATDPAKPATDPAKPATDPAKPATDPAKPATDPAKPATDPAKPPE